MIRWHPNARRPLARQPLTLLGSRGCCVGLITVLVPRDSNESMATDPARNPGAPSATTSGHRFVGAATLPLGYLGRRMDVDGAARPGADVGWDCRWFGIGRVRRWVTRVGLRLMDALLAYPWVLWR